MNWELLQSFVVDGNTQEFLEQVAESLQTGNKQFGILQEGLRTQCFQQVPNTAARDFVCQALLRLIVHENTEGKTPIAHLLLEALPPNDGSPAVLKGAAQLFSVCCCVEHARLAVKVAQVFSIKLTDIEDQQQCRHFVHTLLQDKALLTPAVGFLLHFPQLSAGLSISEVLEGLVEEGQLGLAQRWAATLPHQLQIGLVAHCVAFDRLKEAVKLVRHLNLQQTFPNINEMYRQRTLTRLLEKEQWAVAATYAGQDVQCQEQVVRALALAGESALAEETREQFGLSKDTLDIDSAEAAAQRASTADTYLPLQLSAEAVLFIDDESALSRCQQLLQDVQVVGLDAEWKPNTSGEQNPVSILQVATHSAVLLFDMPKLRGSAALDLCVTSLLHNPGIIKLGCRLSDDVAKLHKSYPDMQAFQAAVALLDLTGPWTLYMQENNDRELQGRRRGAPVGLSNMTRSLLGKPLNKGMQMSDWEKRPLSSRQLEYAALDAFVLLQLYDVISNPNTGLSQAQLQSCLYSHHAQRPSPRRTSPRRLPKDTHPDQQISSQQHPPSQESVPATLPVSHTSSPSRKSSHPSLPSTHSARQRHSRAAAEPSSAVAVTAPWQGSAEQNGTVGSSGVTDRSALQECLQSHGLQSAMRTHSSLGAG